MSVSSFSSLLTLKVGVRIRVTVRGRFRVGRVMIRVRVESLG